MSSRSLLARAAPSSTWIGSLVLIGTLSILLTLTLASSPGGAVHADRVSTTIAAGTRPIAVAVNPVTNKTYVVVRGSNNVTVIDGSDHSTTTVAAGTRPFRLAGNPVTN
ncbi:MAG: hypothetical protein IIC33_10925, partial [Chloroflexi bacterium]|nr:hypothetical protein [Chloroflexota bacterium]